ncbi:MAG: hypothetical protein JEZ09_10975 [Salinivirgaceae bacterium]|nr:hypothetical protein [Salinivirgaceae bacterium]
MNLKTKLSIGAIICIILGFSILHNSNKTIENIASVLIAIGCIYLLVLLLTSNKSKNKSPEK